MYLYDSFVRLVLRSTGFSYDITYNRGESEFDFHELHFLFSSDSLGIKLEIVFRINCTRTVEQSNGRQTNVRVWNRTIRRIIFSINFSNYSKFCLCRVVCDFVGRVSVYNFFLVHQTVRIS